MNPQRYSLILLLLVSLDVRGAEPRGGPAGTFRTDVPAEPFNLILGRPTRSSVAVSVLTSTDTAGFIRYGAESDPCTNRTETVDIKAGESRVVRLDGLRADTGYRYVFCHRPATSTVFQSSAEHTFRTQRPPGAAFTFTITADSHLDENTAPAIYAKTIRNALADQPDFHIDLGDTFMTGKRRDRPEDALPQYLA